MTTVSTQFMSSLNALNLNASAKQATETRSAIVETRNKAAEEFSVVNHIDSSSQNWIGIQDSLAEGLAEIAFVLVSDETLQELEGYLISLKAELEGAADPNALIALEEKISHLVGQNKLFKTDNLNIMSVDVDLNEKASLTSLSDYAEVVSLNVNELTKQMIFLEVDMQVVDAAFHEEDGCVECESDDVAANTNEVVADMAAATTTTTGLPANNNPTSSGTTYIDALINDSIWNISSGDPLTYSFYNGTVGYDDPNYASRPEDDTAAALSAANKANAVQAFDLWDQASGISFQEVTEAVSGGSNVVGDLRVAYSDTMPLNTSTPDPTDRAAAFALSPFTLPIGGDIWFDSGVNSGYLVNQNLNPGTYGFQTAIHEFGHAIGLSHPFDGGSATGDTLSGLQDNWRHTIMSYNQSSTYASDRNLIPTSFTYNANGTFSWQYSKVYVATPMVYDIATVEYLYGVSTDANSGNTSHTVNQYGLSTIVDSDGVDTLDASAETTASTINLSPGSYSSIGTTTREAYAVAAAASLNTQAGGGLNTTSIAASLMSNWANLDASDMSNDAIYTGQENLAIAYSATIENAKGGSGNDTIQGSNNVDNAILGGGGDDAIDGLGGTDTAVYAGNYADFTITHNGDGTITVVDNNATDGSEGTDTLTSIEAIEFADFTYDVATQNTAATGVSALVSGAPASGITPGTATTPTAPSGAASQPQPGSLATQSITSVGLASLALDSVDAALSQVDSYRVSLGSVANRLEYAAANLLSRIEQQSAAKSRILDSDYAVETTKLIREKIRQQVATVMLGQANMSTQQVVQLLK